MLQSVRWGGSRVVVVGVLAWLAPNATTVAQTAGVTAPLTYQAAIDRALESNPALVAARLARPASVARIGVARERLNPEARIELERETPTRAYGVAVPIELGSKRARRIAVSEADLRTGDAAIAQALVDVRASVRLAYFGAVAADQRVTLLDDMRGIAARARDAAAQRFDAGSAPRLEVLQAELALAQAENEAAAARAAGVAAHATLNALLGLPIESTAPLATSLDAGSMVSRDEAMARARAENAELQVVDRRIDAQRARVALARSLQAPDVTPEATITRGAEPEFSTGWRAGVALTLPVFTRHRAGVQVEAATLAQFAAERTAVVTRLDGEVAAASTLAEAQRQQYLRYRDQILPQAVEVERMAEDAYRLGQSGITVLLQALTASRDARLRALQAGSDYQSALAALERAIGAPLP